MSSEQKQTQWEQLGLTDSQWQKMQRLGFEILDPRVGSLCACGEYKAELFIVCQFWTCAAPSGRSVETRGPAVILSRKLADQTREGIQLSFDAACVSDRYGPVSEADWDKVFHIYQ